MDTRITSGSAGPSTGRTEAGSDLRSLKDLEMPRLIPVAPNLQLASFWLMKLRPATHMLDQAEQRGELKPGGIVIESSSVSFGMALAFICARRGYQLHLVTGKLSIDERSQRRIRQLGATLDVVEAPAPEGGYQRSRLDRLQQIKERYPDAFWTRQYANTDNPDSYAAVADHLLDRLDSVDTLIGPVGTGGSMCGTARRLREHNPNLHLVGVDIADSATFGQPDAERLLRGAGNSIVPENVDFTAFNEVHWIKDLVGFAATRKLHERHGVFMGGTTGAAYQVANWWAERNPDHKVVVFGPDEGNRYIDTIYNDSWLEQLPGYGKPLPESPRFVGNPRESHPWSAYPWNRRSRDEVLGRGSRQQLNQKADREPESTPARPTLRRNSLDLTVETP